MRSRPALSLLAVALGATQIGATDCGEVIRDRGFELWCGEQLCDWETERGQAVRVPTWHKGDDGVELVGDDVAIAQMTPVDSNDGDCIRFEFVADVDESATVELEIDVWGDGAAIERRPVPTSHWAKTSFLLRIESPYRGILFRVTKRGAGRAVLANIGAHMDDACAGAALPSKPSPDGGACSEDGDCASGRCVPGFFTGTCGTCDATRACDGGGVCGVEVPITPVLTPYLGCGDGGRHALGELCAFDDECATGLCREGYCAACADAAACGGATCAARELPGVGRLGPLQCPLHTGTAGTACLADADCASGRCNGDQALRQCKDDGRRCGEDDDCYVRSSATAAVSCVTVGIAGGTCQ